MLTVLGGLGLVFGPRLGLTELGRPWTFLAGFGVFLFKPREPRARIFYWLSLSFGAAVIIGGIWVGTTADLAAMAEHLLSDNASWITGQVFHVDGGMSELRT